MGIYQNEIQANAGDSQLPGQTPQGNANLYDSGYGAASRANQLNVGNSASDLANQGLGLIKQGDQFNGIMALLGAENQNPSLAHNQAFLRQLQAVEGGPTTGYGQLSIAAPRPRYVFNAPNPDSLPAANQNYASNPRYSFVAPHSGIQQAPPYSSFRYLPPDFINNGGNHDAVPNRPTMNGSAVDATLPVPSAPQSDVVPLAQKGLADMQQNPSQGIVELMNASAANPSLLKDQNFLAAVKQTLPGAAHDAQGRPMLQTNANFRMPLHLTDTRTDPATQNPQLLSAFQQSLKMIAGGDQADGTLVLMAIAQADPQILQDAVAMQNIQLAEQAALRGQQAGQPNYQIRQQSFPLPIQQQNYPIQQPANRTSVQPSAQRTALSQDGSDI